MTAVAHPRFDLLTNAEKSVEERHLHRQWIENAGLHEKEWWHCRDDPLYWINHYAYTCDPRDLSTWPFDLFPKQAEFIRWLEKREKEQKDGVVEKSRDVGATWLCCAYALHGWLFRLNFHVGFGSRKLELVDRLGDLDCIFEKMRFLLYALPPWMQPRGYERSKHDNHARLVNPQTGNTITGEGGDEIGRGGRKTVYFVDEAAFLARPQLVERALSQTTRVRIDVSTHNGPGTAFYRKRFGGQVAVFVFDWKDDPRKNYQETTPEGRLIYPWYEEQKRRFDKVTVAQEIDRDASASIEGICIPAQWVQAAINLPLAPGGKKVAGLDVGEEGPDLSVVIGRSGALVAMEDIVSWARCNTTETAWRAKEALVRMDAKEVRYDVGGPGMGVKGTWTTTEKRLPFQIVPVNFGGSPSEHTRWPDGETSAEKFANIRAEMWWNLRTRFERTYEYVMEGKEHAYDEMISIPNHQQLIAELSMVLVEYTDKGKIQLESKKKMKTRGVKSPDFGDALALAFYVPKLKEFWVR